MKNIQEKLNTKPAAKNLAALLKIKLGSLTNELPSAHQVTDVSAPMKAAN